jgi:glycosyltransferase involved in cell wall biosynthesis
MIRAKTDGPIRIIYIIGSLHIGGAERQLTELVKRLDKRRFAPVVLCLFEAGGPLRAEVDQAGVPVDVIGFRGFRKQYANPKLIVHNIRSFIKLIFYLRRAKPHITHAFLVSSYLITGVASRLAGVPVVIAARRNERTGDIYLPWLEKLVNRLVDAVFVVSKAVGQDAVAGRLVAPHKVHLIYNGIDLAPFESPDVLARGAKIRRQFNGERDCLLAGVVASLAPRKGHIYLLHAVAQVLAERSDIRFLFIGRDDGCQTGLEQMAQDLGVSGLIIFVGECHDIPGVLGALDLQILPSLVEGFSVAILEGMASSLPLIVTNVGGNAEAVQDGITGLVVPPADSEHLAEAILRIANNAVLRQQMGQAGQARVRRLFSIERTVEEHESQYLQLLIKKIADG